MRESLLLPLSASAVEDHTKISYRIVRGVHTLWSGLVCPLALIYFYHAAGPHAGLGFLPWLWGSTAVIFAEQYFYPERLCEALLTTGTVAANLVLSLVIAGPSGFMLGFYLTFLSGLVFVSLSAAVLFFTPLWQLLGFNNPLIVKINGIKDFLNFLFIWSLLCGPVLLGPILFSKPLLKLLGMGWPFYILMGLMGLQAARMIRQVVAVMRGTGDPAVKIRKQLYDGAWGTASAIAWLLQFGLSLPLIFR